MGGCPVITSTHQQQPFQVLLADFHHPLAHDRKLPKLISARTMASQVSSEAAQAQVADAETLSDDTVVIVGGGPVGLTLATVLAYYGVKSVLFERNQTTTR